MPGGVRGYLATFASPNPIMIPLNFIESITRTFSLLVRLFGNVMSGVFVVGIVLSLAGLLVPIPLMALDLLTGAVQAYIFAILAMVFIAGAIGESTPAPDISERKKAVMNWLAFVSIISAAMAVSFGAIGPALAEGRAVAAAMDAIARQPEVREHHLADALRWPRHDRDHGDLLPGDRAAPAVRQSAAEVTP